MEWHESALHEFTHGAEEAYVNSIAVRRGFRGKGIGTMLLYWAEERARERHAKVMTLGVLNGNPAERLYERLGFEENKALRPDNCCEAAIGACCVCCCFGPWLYGCSNQGGHDMIKRLS